MQQPKCSLSSCARAVELEAEEYSPARRGFVLVRQSEQVRLRSQPRMQFEPQNVFVARSGVAAEQFVQCPRLLVRAEP